MAYDPNKQVDFRNTAQNAALPTGETMQNASPNISSPAGEQPAGNIPQEGFLNRLFRGGSTAFSDWVKRVGSRRPPQFNKYGSGEGSLSPTLKNIFSARPVQFGMTTPKETPPEPIYGEGYTPPAAQNMAQIAEAAAANQSVVPERAAGGGGTITAGGSETADEIFHRTGGGTGGILPSMRGKTFNLPEAKTAPALAAGAETTGPGMTGAPAVNFRTPRGLGDLFTQVASHINRIGAENRAAAHTTKKTLAEAALAKYNQPKLHFAEGAIPGQGGRVVDLNTGLAKNVRKAPPAGETFESIDKKTREEFKAKGANRDSVNAMRAGYDLAPL